MSSVGRVKVNGAKMKVFQTRMEPKLEILRLTNTIAPKKPPRVKHCGGLKGGEQVLFRFRCKEPGDKDADCSLHP